MLSSGNGWNDDWSANDGIRWSPVNTHLRVSDISSLEAGGISAADAFVFVTPDYNVGISAPLKNAIDVLYDEWADKPGDIVSYRMTRARFRAVQ